MIQAPVKQETTEEEAILVRRVETIDTLAEILTEAQESLNSETACADCDDIAPATQLQN